MKTTLLPPDLPGHCPECGEELTLLRNVRVRYGRWGRQMKKAAWVALPVGLMVATLFALRQGGPIMDRSLGFGIFVLIFFPTLILEGVVFLCRKVRTMRCHQCPWEQDFPFETTEPQTGPGAVP